MPMSDEDRAAFAASAPVYVEPAEDGTFRLVSTETGAALSVEHATPKKALAAIPAELLAVKAPVLHTDGEPDGAWRWLDATAEEDEPLAFDEGPDDKVRIVERTCWELAADLNGSPKPAPINGGGAEAGFEPSLPHGDAQTGDGAHKANGWAHAGAVVYAADGRPHLYLWSELIESVAKEVDRGRLAFGSVFFGFSGVDPDDNYAAQGAELISHALTNDPAVKTLAPGSARTVTRAGKRLACRSPWRAPMADQTETTITPEQFDALLTTLVDPYEPKAERAAACRQLVAARGAIADAADKVAAALGLTPADFQADPWVLADAVFDLTAGIRIEQRLEASGAGAAEPPPAAGEMAAERSRAARAEGDAEGETAPRALMGEEAETYAAAAADLFRTVLGKPDASEAELLEEMQARAEEIGAALGTDTPPDDGEEPPAEETAGAERSASAARSRAAAVRERALREAAEKDRDAARAQLERFETRDWLDAEASKRGLPLSDERRAKFLTIALTAGRPTVEAFLDELNAPPTGEHPFARSAQRGPAPASIVEATRALMSEARAAMREERGDGEPVPNHLVVARAERMARARFPELAAG